MVDVSFVMELEEVHALREIVICCKMEVIQMMIRSFLPVGQGAFYCEQFGDKYVDTRMNIIYDCGSATDINLVRQQIVGNFAQDEVVHALFVSHLDADHINGIPYLLKHCYVKKMFFPLLTPEDKRLTKLCNMVNERMYSSLVESFMDNPYNFFERFAIPQNRWPRLYQIEDNSEGNNSIEAIHIPSGSNVKNEIFTDDEIMKYRLKKWRYIPYNFRQKERILQLERAIYDKMGRYMCNDDLCDIWKTGTDKERENIKAAYRTVKGDFNTNSMTLYSGNREVYLRQYVFNGGCIRRCCTENEYPAGCLYTGDYDASGKDKWTKLKNAYDKYWDSIGCIQIPHHGSRHNYNKELAKCNACYIISAEKTNRYQHPSGLVVKDLLFNGHFPYIVTEDKTSEVCFVIDM